MTCTRVNLLKKSELRYQGAVSRRLVVAGVVAAPILLASVLSGIKLVQHAAIQSELKDRREAWQAIEPQLAVYLEENKGLESNRKILDLFEGWDKSQGSFVKLLSDIQASVPENVQFVRLSIRGNSQAKVFKQAEDMDLDYALVIEGISQGDRAEDEVINLRKDLLKCEQIGATFESVKLASMRKREGAGDIGLREFKLEGETAGGSGK